MHLLLEWSFLRTCFSIMTMIYARGPRLFLAVIGSRLRIANVNIGTSGADRGLWRREKTGGGGISSETWKAYMNDNEYD